MRQNPTKATLAQGKSSVGTWLSLANWTSARFLSRTGFDWLNMDLEHSQADMENSATIFDTCADQGCVALARVPSNRHDHIKRVLDIGAQGVVVPMVNSVEEARSAVKACLYPPEGDRSVGGRLHALNFQTSSAEYNAKANREILIVLQCEHKIAVENIDAILSVGGFDALFVGPNDLAASYRTADGKSPSGEEMAQVHQTILEACQRHSIAPGFHAMTPEEGKMRLEQGWRFVAVSSDLRFMLDGAEAALRATGKGNNSASAKY